VGHEGMLFVGGEWSAPVDRGAIDVISPHTEQVWLDEFLDVKAISVAP
jgi:hypothetical protein